MRNQPILLQRALHQKFNRPSITSRGVSMSSNTTQLGFPPTQLVAPADKRYINKYYYDASANRWDLIVDCKRDGQINHWVVREVDPTDGRPVGHLRKHTTDLWANRFADRPFDPQLPDQDDWSWFVTLSGGTRFHTVEQLHTLFDAYLERRKEVSSYDALVRIGMREAVK